ncbi:DUF2155 domain-containing protein [Sulfitobacter aestuarii]|uniref:DUF2155 domain-containing protein n=1 Tax=Sulfitobacter aestuarii TaxID=2161676 RepID=A0ABW5U204_9RHOB
MRKFLIALSLLAAPLSLQAQEQIASAPAGLLRALDKTSGHTVDLEVTTGQAVSLGTLSIRMSDCRYPAGNPAGNAYAALQISEQGNENPIFSGWMIASAPALNALEHQRYDVWVMRCTTS